MTAVKTVSTTQSTLFDMEEDIHRLEGFIRCARMIADRGALNGLDKTECAALDVIVLSAIDTFTQIESDWQDALDLAIAAK